MHSLSDSFNASGGIRSNVVLRETNNGVAHSAKGKVFSPVLYLALWQAVPVFAVTFHNQMMRLNNNVTLVVADSLIRCEGYTDSGKSIGYSEFWVESASLSTLPTDW